MKWKLGEFEDGLGYFYGYLKKNVFSSHINQKIQVKYNNHLNEGVTICYVTDVSIGVKNNYNMQYEISYDDMLVYPFFSTEKHLGIMTVKDED